MTAVNVTKRPAPDAATPVRVMGGLERDGLVLAVDSLGLRLRALDYQVPPLHLRREALRQLGFVLLAVGRRRLQPSAALAWSHEGSRWQPRGSLPEGVVLDGYVLARVRGGLDVFVTSYRASQVRVGHADLARVGLRVRRTPLRAKSTQAAGRVA